MAPRTSNTHDLGLKPFRANATRLGHLFGIRQQRVLAIIAIKEMEAADPGPFPGALARRPRDPEAGAPPTEGVSAEGEEGEEQGSSSSDSDDSEMEVEEVTPVAAGAEPKAAETWEDWCASFPLYAFDWRVIRNLRKNVRSRFSILD